MKCAPVEFEVDRYQSGPDAVVFDVVARTEGREVGSAALLVTEWSRFGWAGKLARVANIGVRTERCGLGTRLYERLQKLACAENAHLASDVSRTEASEGFWRKQVNKGRARCLTDREEGIRLKASGIGLDKIGQWSCNRYVMREACPRKIDLSGWRHQK